MKKKIIFIILLLGLVVTFDVVLMSWNSEVEALSKYGSRGTEVRTIQEKLKRWGYYSGSVDGIYGSQTVSAVKSFQKKNGLTVDGIAGTQTLKAMGITSSSSSSSSSNNSSNVNLLARVVYGEARGEPYTGQVAVADGQINMTPDTTAKKAAQDALNGWDPSYGAIYYFNPSTATNKWIWSRPMTVTIGKHRFCK